MKKQSKNARTFSEWWQPRYVFEHRIVGILLGFLFGALITLTLGILSKAKVEHPTRPTPQRSESIETG